MKAFRQFWDMSKKNKAYVVFIIAICLGVIEFTTHFFSGIPTMVSGDHQVVAVVQSVTTDVRQKPVEEEAWYRAEPPSDVIRGDAVYTAKQSNASIRMQSGGMLELGEETLVIFDDVDGVTVPDVTRGKVKIKISGDMRIAISGQMTEFSGSQSELELDLKNGSLRALKGKVGVTRKGASIRNLVTGQEMEIPVASGTVPKIQIPKAGDLNSEVKLSDKRKGIKTEPVIAKATPEPVQDLNVNGPEVAEMPPLPEPEPVKITEALSIPDPAKKIDRVMKVQEVYQRHGQRALVPRRGMKTLKVPIALAWNGTKPDEKVFVQVAKDGKFTKTWTEREATGANIVVPEWKPGRNFWRVSRDRQNWSDPAEVFVHPTVAPKQKPTIAIFKKNVVVYPKGRGPEAQAKLRFQDSGLPNPRGWVLQGSNSPEFHPSKTRTVYVSEPRVDVPLKKPGKYFFRVRSVASAGEISGFSSPMLVSAAKAAASPVQIRQAQKAPEVREVANVEPQEDFTKQEEPVARQTLKTRSVLEKEPERRYRPWSVTIEGGETALVSSDQLASSSAPASIHVLGLRGEYNNGRHSLMGSYHSKFGASNAEGNAQGNSRLDSRYTHWWQTKWNWLRLGWAAGLSSYDNSASSNFSKGYTAAKTGLGVNMSIGDRWKTGGDVLMGTWTNQNLLYEFGGFITYEFNAELAFGVGYRVSLFEAAVDSATPFGLPYREAMGEAYSSLKFSF